MGSYIKPVFGRYSIFAKLLAVFSMILFVGANISHSVYADSSISMTIDSDSLVIGIIPNSASGTFASSSDLNVSVSLTGIGGYTLGIRSSSSDANATKLINTTDNTKYFSSIASAVTASNYANNSYATSNNLNNTWGYLPSKFNSTNNTSYRPAPSDGGDIIESTSGENDSGSYTISIGARADLDTALGSYTNTFVITAVANYSCNPNATDIHEALCMQDINDDVINSMTMETQYRLYDNRDWKQYYIARMKDGRVWMTQNLDLDLETTSTNVSALTSENTDLNLFGSSIYTTTNGYACSNTGTTTNCTADGEVITWTPSSATLPKSSASSWSNNNTAIYSIDWEEYYYYTNASGTNGGNTAYSTKAACESAHNDGTCQHYHVGNYYNFTAAVASNTTSGITSNYKVMKNSICPAGWRLPASKTSTSSTNPGYYAEINYTLVSEGIMTDYVSSRGTNGTYADDGWKKSSNAPMYLTRGGYKTGTGTSLGNAGRVFYRTSTIYNGTYSYGYYGYTTVTPIYASTYSTRGYGVPVRCVARQDNTGSTVITFDKNASDAIGTTGTDNTQTISANTFGNLSNNGFSRDGYLFNSWNTEPDGSGETYAEGVQYYGIAGTATTNMTLYAIWDKAHTITFNLGSHVSKIVFDGTAYTDGQTTQAVENRAYNIAGDYDTKYSFYSWSATAGTIANQHPATTYIVPSSNATITLTGQEATVNMSTLPISTDPVSSTCKNEAVTPILTYDPRDNEAYWVARLCDGNYWMLDNLRLDLTNSTVVNNLSTSNTNADADSLTSLKSGNRANGDQYATAGLPLSNWTSGNSYSPQVNVSGSVTAGSNNNTWTGSYTKDTIAPVTYGLGSGKIGAYYNYCAASAGSYCYDSISTDPNSGYLRDISSDICPKNWKMPTGSSGGEYQNLYAQYSGATIGQDEAFKNALSTPLSGYFYSSSMWNYGYAGVFSSSTWSSGESLHNLFVYANSTSPSGSYSRMGGLNVRCVYYDPVTITVNFSGGGVENVTFSKSDGQVIVVTNGSTVTLERNKAYNITITSSARYAVTGWSATAGAPTSSSRGVTTYTPSGDATITITSQEATTDMTTLVASSDPVSSNCKNEAVTPILTYDPRDNEAYWVARLCDGNYWMLDNLRLDLTNSTVVNNLSTSNTNADADSLTSLKSGNRANGDQYATAGLALSNWTTGTSYSVPQVNVSGSVTAGSNNNTWTGYYTKDTIAPVTYGLGSGKIGVYYNYCAASAGSYCYGNATGVTGIPTTDPKADSLRDIDSDICPKGWRIPTSSSSGEYQNLYTQYSDATIGQAAAFRNALSASFSGYLATGSGNGQGNNFGFWSSTWYGNSRGSMYVLFANGVNVISPSSNMNEGSNGASVRCVLNQ